MCSPSLRVPDHTQQQLWCLYAHYINTGRWGTNTDVMVPSHWMKNTLQTHLAAQPRSDVMWQSIAGFVKASMKHILRALYANSQREAHASILMFICQFITNTGVSGCLSLKHAINTRYDHNHHTSTVDPKQRWRYNGEIQTHTYICTGQS